MNGQNKNAEKNRKFWMAWLGTGLILCAIGALVLVLLKELGLL